MESINLIIRKSTFDDCKLFAEWESDPDVTKFFSFDDSRDYEEVTREYILKEADDTNLQYTIVLIDEDLPIGRIFISRINPHADSLDITRLYIGNTDYRGKGFGEEALRLLLEHCFLNLHMERVSLDHFPDNQVAANLYSKLGFQYEGIARNVSKKNGKYYNFHLMSMLRSEFFEHKNSIQ